MITTIQKQLENISGLKLKLKINDNRSTMLSVKWEPDCTKVSLHRMFLQAPENVMDALACYLRQEDKNIASTVKDFIEKNLKDYDYTHQVDHTKLSTQGKIYDLKKIYNEINQEYFNGKLKLSITWFGKANKRCRSRVTFGLYHEPLQLIKINRLLDSTFFPEYIVYFVVYHEILHHVYPPYYDENGYHHIHNKEFKVNEALYKHFDLSQEWIKKNQTNFFL